MVAALQILPANNTCQAPLAVVVGAWAATRQAAARSVIAIGEKGVSLWTPLSPFYSRAMSRKLIKTIDAEALPGVLREIAVATDVATALIVAAHKGGTKAYFSRFPKPDCWLAEIVGHRNATKIGEAVAPAGGISLLVPLGGHRDFLRLQVTLEMIRQGRSKAEIARHLKVHERTVQRYRAHLRREKLIGGSTP